MFTPEDRDRIRSELLDAARADVRLSGGAITGSAAEDRQDPWSDIDLAFGVVDGAPMAEVIEDWTARMVARYGAVHHLDVASGRWIYRVFLLASTLQVDLAFAPAADFGARAPTFRLVFGEAAELPHVTPPAAAALIGYAWLYGLHVRSSLARGRLWQAEHMLGAMRNQVLALACVRHGLPAREARGVDRLPAELLHRFEGTLVRRIDASAIAAAFRTTNDLLLDEAHAVDPELAGRIDATVRAVGETPTS